MLFKTAHIQSKPVRTSLKRNRIMNKKVILIGDTNVGKTSVLNRFAAGNFRDTTNATVTGSFRSKDILINNPENPFKGPDEQDIVRIQLWDTAGQERYKSLAKIYFQRADAAIIVYDISHKKSLEQAHDWSNLLNEYLDDECTNK